MRIVYLKSIDGNERGQESFVDRPEALKLCEKGDAVPANLYAKIQAKEEAEREIKKKRDEAERKANAEVESAREERTKKKETAVSKKFKKREKKIT